MDNLKEKAIEHWYESDGASIENTLDIVIAEKDKEIDYWKKMHSIAIQFGRDELSKNNKLWQKRMEWLKEEILKRNHPTYNLWKDLKPMIDEVQNKEFENGNNE